jgi:hypothetical protein
MPSVITNGSFPNRIALYCAPLTGPFLFPSSPPIVFDPKQYLTCFADGIALSIISSSFDSANNRYLIFMSTQFNLQGVVQVCYHMPLFVGSSPNTFQDSGSPPANAVGGFSLIATYVPSGI